MKKAFLIAAIAVALSGCATSGSPQWKSTQLQQGFTEQDVIARIGKPDAISLNTCGGANGIATWQCKQYKYTGGAWGGGGLLVVFFDQFPDGSWHVNNWNAI